MYNPLVCVCLTAAVAAAAVAAKDDLVCARAHVRFLCLVERDAVLPLQSKSTPHSGICARALGVDHHNISLLCV